MTHRVGPAQALAPPAAGPAANADNVQAVQHALPAVESGGEDNDSGSKMGGHHNQAILQDSGGHNTLDWMVSLWTKSLMMHQAKLVL